MKDLVGKDFAVTLRAELVYGGQRRSYGDEEKSRLLHNYYRIFHGSDSTLPSVAVSVLPELHSPNSIREFCFLTRNHESSDGFQLAAALSSDLDHQFSMEIISDIQPYPAGRRHRAALILFLYVVNHAKHLLMAHSKVCGSFQTMYGNIVSTFESLPMEPLQDALETLGDRVVIRRPEERHFAWGDYYQFTHPVYLDGVKRALEDAQVRRFMVHVVLALGEEHECNACQYQGPFIHAYEYRCNELNPEGPVCPQCHTWAECGYVLEGVSLPYALEPVYESLGMICYFTITIANEQLKVTMLNTFLEQYSVRRLVQMIVRHVNHIGGSRDSMISEDDVYLLWDGAALTNETPLIKISNKTLALGLIQASRIKVEGLGSRIHDESTNIDW